MVNVRSRLRLDETFDFDLPTRKPEQAASSTRRQPEKTASSTPLPEKTASSTPLPEKTASSTPLPEKTASSTPPLSLETPWIISIREKLDQTRQYAVSSQWATQSIYRVPKSLADVDETAYSPNIVSIGPYHRDRLHDMDRHKWRALQCALDRTGHDVRLYIDAVRSLEDSARACYEAPLSISSDDFVGSLLLDSIFALELFRRFAGEDGLGYAAKDPVFSDRGGITILSIQRDMILLENQLPLFVLDRILALQLGHGSSTSSFVARLAFHFFHNLRPTDEPFPSADHLLSDAGSSEALHCLDFFRRSLLLAGPKPDRLPRLPAGKPWRKVLHCVTELSHAGFKFRRRKSESFWDIRFDNGVLHIPRLLIHDPTKSLFLNLIAFEQCHLLGSSSHITAYVMFMDSLISSKGDVKYLRSMGIIEHWLENDEEVADFINQLCQEVVFDTDDSYLSELSERVNRYYEQSWNAWIARLAHKYFSNPWSMISSAGALFLLLLSSAQTFYAVFSYYKTI